MGQIVLDTDDNAIRLDGQIVIKLDDVASSPSIATALDGKANVGEESNGIQTEEW
jgi:hypothetical protein